MRLLTPADLAQLPPPRYLVRELVRESGFSVAFGPAGIGKTFLVLDIALCIASGTDFFDHQAERGLVVYVAAEGASGLHQRISAWLEARDVPPEAIADGLRVVGEPVNFYAGETGSAARCHRRARPSTVAARRRHARSLHARRRGEQRTRRGTVHRPSGRSAPTP